MMIGESQAAEVAREFLTRQEIPVLGIKRIRKIDGGIRAEYLPKRDGDFWLVTFERSKGLVGENPDMDAESVEILTAVAEANDTVTVAVEMDGTAELA